MDGFACSSWYELRYTSPHLDTAPFDRKAVDYWLPVDLYVGGAEHAVMHLLYSRFWTKVMYDAGLVGFKEPFARLMNQGMLLSYDGQKMSKSRHNVITPDEVVEQYGADTLRLYELFMAPFEQEVSWSKEGISGATASSRGSGNWRSEPSMLHMGAHRCSCPEAGASGEQAGQTHYG